MQLSSLLLVPLTLCVSAVSGLRQDEPKIRFHTVDGRGAPKSGVEVYEVGSYIEGLMVGEVGKSDKSGVVMSDDDEGDYVGIARDGSVATMHNSRRLAFGRTGDLTLRVIDDRGKPLAGVQTTLIPSAGGGPLRIDGSLQCLNDLPAPYAKAMSRMTDARGYARFHKLPVGKRFGVITHAAIGDIQYRGSVPVGGRAQVLLSSDRVISGHVYEADGKTPIAHADVAIYVSSFSSGGAPEPRWRGVTTGADGAYRVDKLPNCELEVSVGTDQSGIVMTRVNHGTWLDHGVLGTVAAEGYTYQMGTGDIPSQRATTLDFRIEPPAIVTVTLRNPLHRNLEKLFISLGQVVNGRIPEGGSGLSCNRQDIRLAAGYGRYALYLSGDALPRNKVLATLDIKDASPIHLSLDVP